MLRSVHTADDVDAWGSLLSNYFLPVQATEEASEDQIHPGKNRCFRASIYGKKWGTTTFAELVTATHKISQRSTWSDEGEKYLKLNVQATGRGIIMQDGKEAVLEAGEFAFLDSNKPYSVLYEGDSISQVLQFPSRLLNLPEEPVRELSVLPFTRANPLTKPLTGIAQESSQALLSLPESISRRLTRNLIDFLSTVIANELYTGVTNSLELDQMRRREMVLAFIRENLAAPDLNPRTIAAANYISVRALHQLFEGTGDTVSGTVLGLRLLRCREDLESPAHAATSISDIAARWGFSDAAHFSRAFRQKYGTTPSEWRASANALNLH